MSLSQGPLLILPRSAQSGTAYPLDTAPAPSVQLKPAPKLPCSRGPGGLGGWKPRQEITTMTVQHQRNDCGCTMDGLTDGATSPCSVGTANEQPARQAVKGLPPVGGAVYAHALAGGINSTLDCEASEAALVACFDNFQPRRGFKSSAQADTFAGKAGRLFLQKRRSLKI